MIFVLVFFSCSVPSLIVEKKYSTLRINLESVRGWTPAKYEIEAKSGDLVKTAVCTSNSTSMNLDLGLWNINVIAKDSNENIIYQGNASINLSLQTESVTIPLLEESGNCKIIINNESAYSIQSGKPAFIEKIVITANRLGFDSIVKELTNFSDTAIFAGLAGGNWDFLVECKAKSLNDDYTEQTGFYTTYLKNTMTKSIVTGKVQNFIFGITTQTKVTPVIASVASGNVSSGTSLVLTCDTPLSSIKYQKNNDATADYTTPISLAGNNGDVITIKVIGSKNGLESSIINKLTYQIIANTVTPEPQFSPIGGTYNSPQLVTLSCSDINASIYYTVDGVAPTIGNTKYSTPIQINTTTIIKAIAKSDGKDPSGVVSQTYTINMSKVSTPVILPQTGSYDTTTDFSLSSGTAGALIYYTIDGATPTKNSTLYTAPFKLTAGSKTIKAIAVKEGYLDSDVGVGSYTITEPFTGIIIYFEKPDSWSNAFIWFDKDSNGVWETTALGVTPGDMVNYRTGWYKKEVSNTASITFLFNDGTWNNKLNDSGKDFVTTKTIWITKTGSKLFSDPIAPQVPVLNTNPAGGYFSSATVSVTLIVTGTNIVSSSYTLDGTDPKTSGTAINFTNGQIITIGSGMNAGDSKTVKMYSTNNVGEVFKDFTFIKVDSTQTTDVDNLRLYQVMVESFQDGDPYRDYNTGYGPSNHKGDIRGIINALDYIKSLGVNALWLTPIFDSDGTGALDATGYFCRDYFTIDPKFGSLDDAKELVQKAHQKGLYVFLDGVFGHHKGWVKPSPTGKTPSGGSDPVSYPGSLDFYKEVATYWIDTLEIDGWRLDQAYQVSTRNQDKNYWQDIRTVVDAKCLERKNAGKEWGKLGYMVGEIWDSETNIQKWGYDAAGDKGLESCFDFPLRYSLVQVLATQEELGQSGAYNQPASKLVQGYNTHSNYSSFAHPNLMLTNHDLVRFGDLIQRSPSLGYGKENPDYWKRHKAAFSFMAAYTGPITIYYGDEIGDEVPNFKNKGDSGFYDDNVSRSNGQITNFDTNQTDLKNYVTQLMNYRATHRALWDGARTNLLGTATIYADLKIYDTEKIIYILNTSTTTENVNIPQASVGGTKLTEAFTNTVIQPVSGNYTVSASGLSGSFFVVE